MSITTDFEMKKKAILASYDRLLSSEIIRDKEPIPENKKQLEDEQFIVSICGAIKTGKSTLLNYLLFDGKPILPLNVTPETARLVKIHKGSSERAIIHFLSQLEWVSYRNRLKTEDKEADDNKISELIMKKRIQVKDFIKEEPYSMELDDIALLSEYISLQSDWLPLIKSAEIMVDDERLNNVIVVDTPGLNDPCKSRSEVTLNWIEKTDALIYLFYAGQPATRQDMDFLDRYCGFIDTNKLILTLGKIDCIKDYQKVEEYINGVLKTKALKDREYLKNQKLYSLSVIAAMLKKCPENLKEIERKHYQNQIGRNCPSLIDEEGYWQEFERAISERLMTYKGNGLLESHFNKLLLIIENSVVQTKRDLDSANDLIESCSSSLAELEGKRIRKEILKQKVKTMRAEVSDRISDETTKCLNAISYGFSRNRYEAEELFKEKVISEKKSFDICVAETSSYYRKAMIACVRDVLESDTLEEFVVNINAILSQMYQSLTQEVDSHDFHITTVKKPVLRSYEIEIRVKELVNQYMNSERMIQSRRRFWGFLWTVEKESIAKLHSAVSEELDKISPDIVNFFDSSIREDLKEQLEKPFDSLDRFLQDVERNITEAESDTIDKSKTIEKLKQDVTCLSDITTKLQSLKGEIVSKLDISGVQYHEN